MIAIIGILVTLLLPAVNSAREAARRTQCINKLKQLGLAALNYESTFRVLPPGTFVEDKFDIPNWVDSNKRNPTIFFILPFMEEVQMFKDFDFGIGAVNQGEFDQARILKTRLPVINCPSDAQVDLTQTCARNNPYPKCNYVTCEGSESQRFMWQRFRFLKTNQYRGVFGMSTFVGFTKISQITDGTSKTLMFSEQLQTPDGDDWRTFWWDAQVVRFHRKETPNTSVPDVLRPCGSRGLCINDPENNAPCNTQAGGDASKMLVAARSRHPGGVNACQADASVRFYTDSIDAFTWSGLGTRSGTEIIEID